MRKWLLAAVLALGFLGRAEAVNPILGTVQITTTTATTPKLQNGTVYIASMTVGGNFVATGTITTGLSIIANGSSGSNGNLLQSQGPGLSPVWIATSTILNNNVFNTTNTWTGGNTYVSLVTFSSTTQVTGSGTLSVSSNTILSGATFYQNARVVVSSMSVSSFTVTSINISTNPFVAGNAAYLLLYSSTVYDVSGASATTVATYVPTKTAITITPKRATSQIEISFSGVLFTSAGNTANAYATLFRNAINLAPGPGAPLAFCAADNSVAATDKVSCGVTLIDLPNTTSPVTYTVEFRNDSAGTAVDWNPANEVGLITVKEWSY